MSKRKIDTHHHFLPKLYVDAVGLDLLNAAMPGGVAPSWSVEAAIAMMDENGIDEAILSISSGPTLPDAATLLRKCNDYAADLRARHTGRFGSFASLPLPDVDAALKEVSYSVDQLKVDGFIVFTNYNGLYLGDPHFRPLWEELDRRGAVVFVHPNQPPHEVPPVAPASVLEYPFETTRTAASLVISGVVNRFRNIRFILSHAGGTLPFLVPRLALSISMMPEAAERVGDTHAAVRSFYFDTALAAGNAPLSALAQVADPDHILFGTDFPFAPTSAIRQFGKVLDDIRIPGVEMKKVYGENAARLLGR
ncbi:amidohydrolase family protein [Paraburkholderia susongensis]|uniref:6-methylsalicylate decarboxylase n=1 Tax=Paraburkholderia susongensis TaxID=1515439 RepID=A0A1X7L8E2_9BURK|nr:amidohydrolase family protein [Paraburkholderia susongensis]SMG50098.1 Predicted metal-dependent hydrolase, TIM-barrel fold [Paraburkholderia susongensis]